MASMLQQHSARGALSSPTIRISEDGTELLVFLDGEARTFPGYFLRDNCRCDECFSETAFERKLDPSTFRGEELIASADWERGSGLRIRWAGPTRGPATHESFFGLDWLRTHALAEGSTSVGGDPEVAVGFKVSSGVSPWDASTAATVVASEEWATVLAEEGALGDWISRLERVGVGILKNVPTLEDLAPRLGYGAFRTTYYGYVFELVARDEASDLGYSTAPLPLHVDLACLRHTPGVQALHYIEPVAGNGGRTMLVDGFEAALRLAQRAPEAAAVLQSTDVAYRHRGTELYGGFDMSAVHRTIQVDPQSHELERIVFSNNKRCASPANGWASMALDGQLRRDGKGWSLAQARAFYEAWHQFYEVACSDDLIFAPEVEPNDVVVFDNHRILHGRQRAVDGQRALRRHVRGAYLDWDDLKSRRRAVRHS